MERTRERGGGWRARFGEREGIGLPAGEPQQLSIIDIYLLFGCESEVSDISEAK